MDGFKYNHSNYLCHSSEIKALFNIIQRVNLSQNNDKEASKEE